MGLTMHQILKIMLAVLAFLVVTSGPPAAAEPAEMRMALVIGNAAYQKGALAAAANDASLIAQTPQAAGFDVVGARDLDEDPLRQTFRDFVPSGNKSLSIRPVAPLSPPAAVNHPAAPTPPVVHQVAPTAVVRQPPPTPPVVHQPPPPVVRQVQAPPAPHPLPPPPPPAPAAAAKAAAKCPIVNGKPTCK
jgi:Caspase domain